MNKVSLKTHPNFADTQINKQTVMFISEFGQPQLSEKTRNCHVLSSFLITTPNVKFRQYLSTWNGVDKHVTDKRTLYLHRISRHYSILILKTA